MIDYNPHRWTSHLFAIRGSMVRVLSFRVLTILAASLAAALVHSEHPQTLPSTVHALVGTALGLLLVFRTNASYDRFWEGRKLWGGIVNETRNLARATSVHLEKAPELRNLIIRLTVAFAWSGLHALRNERSVGPGARLLPDSLTRTLLGAQHIPMAISREITRLLRQAHDRGLISDIVLTSIDNNTQLLIDYLGGCERIHKTPLPFAYVVHLRRALLLYCLTLPFVLVEHFGWWVILGAFIISYIFFGIEEIGVEIEDPFGTDDNDLPLDRICKTIDDNLLPLLAAESGESAPAPADVQPEGD